MNYMFRGKSLIKNVWVCGDLLNYQGKKAICRNGYDFFNTNELDLEEVAPESVGMFTGIHDNTRWNKLSEDEQANWLVQGNTEENWWGRKIFGGDIIHHKQDDKNYCVVYLEVDAGFYLTESLDATPVEIRARPLGRENNYYLRIVGNVYDNVKLLGK